MIKGYTTFLCTNCRNKFKGPDIEFGATVYSSPLRCECCGSIRTLPLKNVPLFLFFSFFGIGKEYRVYENIWKGMEENERKNRKDQDFTKIDLDKNI